MKLIDNYVERFHNKTLPSPNKCFFLEEGDEIFIKKWISDGKIKGDIKEMFEWIEKKYLSNKNKLKGTDEMQYLEIQERFYMRNWRLIVLLSEYQSKYRYYSQAINSIKEKSFKEMQYNDFFKLFEKND